MNRTRPILVVSVVATALFAASAATRAAGDPFLPLGAGARWEYEIHRDRTYRPVGDQTDRTFRSGTDVLAHVRAIEVDGKVIHELRKHREETSMGPGLPPSREVSTQRWANTSGLLLYAIEPTSGAAVRFDPPLQMLPPTPELGSRWRVGTYRSGNLAIPLEGEIVGWEDIDDGAIPYAGCLKVRYRGSVSGPISGETGLEKIQDIRLERVAWWKPGVGLVREIITTGSEIELPEGASARVHEVTTLRLVRHTAPR